MVELLILDPGFPLLLISTSVRVANLTNIKNTGLLLLTLSFLMHHSLLPVTFYTCFNQICAVVCSAIVSIWSVVLLRGV